MYIQIFALWTLSISNMTSSSSTNVYDDNWIDCDNYLCFIRFIGKLDVTPTVIGYNNIEMTREEYIPVETGDVLGMLFIKRGKINYDDVSCANKVNYR